MTMNEDVANDGMMFGEPQSVQLQSSIDPRLHAGQIIHYFHDEREKLVFDPQLFHVFIDWRAWTELLDHLAKDDRRELGGILLGTCVAQDADPASLRSGIWIQEIVPAEFEESTRISLKFTHATWQAIARRKEMVARNLDVLGWYHSHPDWGVFLSSMDLFVCESFFPRPEHTAIVVDPIRKEFGCFLREGRGKYWRTIREFALIADPIHLSQFNDWLSHARKEWRPCLPG